MNADRIEATGIPFSRLVRIVRARGLALWVVAGALILAARAERPCSFGLESVPVYLDVRSPRGIPLVGLTADDFSVLENRTEKRILDFLEVDAASSEISTVSQRFFILHFPESLNMHEEFSGKRVAKLLIHNLVPERDALAIIRGGAISGFTQDPRRMKRMVDYFATDGDRYGFGPPGYPQDGPRPHWYCGDSAGASTSEQAFDRMLRHGNSGSLATLMTGLRALPGRKILLVFGDRNPFEVTDLAHYDAEAAARLTGDAAITVFVLSWGQSRGPTGSQSPPERTRESERLFLRFWAESSGGRVLNLRDRGESAVSRILDWGGHYYYLAYEPKPVLDGRFRTIEVRPKIQSVTLDYRSGYYATVQAPVHLRGRTFQTALADPERYSDIPLQLKVLEKARGLLEVTITFPFQSLDMRPLETEGEDSLRFVQVLEFFFAVFDSSGQLLGFKEGISNFLLEEDELRSLRRQRARISEDVQVSGNAETVVAVLAVGQNRQLSARVLGRGGEAGAFSSVPEE